MRNFSTILLSLTESERARVRYYVAYPIPFDCNLRCSYCFHHERFVSNYTKPPGFTVKQYITWRETHLKDASDILVHFHGGEPFLSTSINIILGFLRQSKVERVDLLTNGLQDPEDYLKILEFRDRVHRIGFTFHRKMIAHIPYLVKQYEDNVMLLHKEGLPVYVKELMMVDEREAIKEYKKKWKDLGVPFKVQDFKGSNRGRDFSEAHRYTAEDLFLIDPEYRKAGTFCSCVRGYKNILICGHTMGGSIIACFEDQRIVGSIQENTWNPDFRVRINRKKGTMEVEGVPPVYYGHREKGVFNPKEYGYE